MGRSRFGMACAVEHRRLRPRHHTPNSKNLTRLSADSSIRRSRRPPLRRGRRIPAGRVCRRRALSQARRARPRPRSSGQSSSLGPDTTVSRVEGSRPLRVFSEYLGIDTTAGQLTAFSCCQLRLRDQDRRAPWVRCRFAWSFAPGCRFQSNAAVRGSRGVFAATSSGVIAREYSISVWGFLPGGSRPSRACAPGHPSWGLPPDRVRPRLRSPQIVIASTAARCFRRLSQRNRRCRLIAGTPRLQPWASVGSGPRHDQPRQRGVADVPQAHASPAAPAAYAPGCPELGSTARCACERVSRRRSDRLGSKYLGLSTRPRAGVDTTDPGPLIPTNRGAETISVAPAAKRARPHRVIAAEHRRCRLQLSVAAPKTRQGRRS